MNYVVKTNLLKLKNAFVVNFKGKKETKLCIVIPIEDNNLFTNKTTVSLEQICFELASKGKYGDTHLCKVNTEKEKYDAMTPEERKAIPIIGNMKPLEKETPNAQEADMSNTDAPDEDYPF